MLKLAITFGLMYLFSQSKYLAIRLLSIALFFTLTYLTLCMLSF
jgi:hypothetical protein